MDGGDGDRGGGGEKKRERNTRGDTGNGEKDAGDGTLRVTLREVEGRAVYENGLAGEVWRFGISTAQTTTTHGRQG
jgi:hypothetical protein